MMYVASVVLVLKFSSSFGFSFKYFGILLANQKFCFILVLYDYIFSNEQSRLTCAKINHARAYF